MCKLYNVYILPYRTGRKGVTITFHEVEKFKEEENRSMLIPLLTQRLHWLTFQADGIEEITRVVELLEILDPVDDPDGYFTPEKGLERFWKYYERREAFEKELRERKAQQQQQRE